MEGSYISGMNQLSQHKERQGHFISPGSGLSDIHDKVPPPPHRRRPDTYLNQSVNFLSSARIGHFRAVLDRTVYVILKVIQVNYVLKWLNKSTPSNFVKMSS